MLQLISYILPVSKVVRTNNDKNAKKIIRESLKIEDDEKLEDDFKFKPKEKIREKIRVKAIYKAEVRRST